MDPDTLFDFEYEEQDDIQYTFSGQKEESDLDLLSERDVSDSEEEDRLETTSDRQEGVYPIYNPPKKGEINMSTGKKYKPSEIRQHYHSFVIDQWKEEPDIFQEDLDPFTFQPRSIPGCQGVELTAASVFKRYFDERIVNMIVKGSNEYSKSDRYKGKFTNRRNPDGILYRPVTLQEMYLWLAVTILTAVHNKQQMISPSRKT